MSERSILPERHFLKITVPLSELRISSSPKDAYRLLFRVNFLNISKVHIRLLARKWIWEDTSHQIHVIEAERVFDSLPVLAPGGVFSYGGEHIFTQQPIHLSLRMIGVDQLLTPFISTPFIFTSKLLTGTI